MEEKEVIALLRKTLEDIRDIMFDGYKDFQLTGADVGVMINAYLYDNLLDLD